jgi:hypothetical protein
MFNKKGFTKAKIENSFTAASAGPQRPVIIGQEELPPDLVVSLTNYLSVTPLAKEAAYQDLLATFLVHLTLRLRECLPDWLIANEATIQLHRELTINPRG